MQTTGFRNTTEKKEISQCPRDWQLDCPGLDTALGYG